MRDLRDPQRGSRPILPSLLFRFAASSVQDSALDCTRSVAECCPVAVAADGSVPVFQNGTIKEFYFGGDGPHYGTRNSSLALIEFREATLAGVGAQPHCEHGNGGLGLWLLP